MSPLKKYIYNCLVADDQWLNAHLGGNPDECLSTRLAKNYPNSLARKFVDAIFYYAFGQKDHCYHSLNNDVDSEVVK